MKDRLLLFSALAKHKKLFEGAYKSFGFLVLLQIIASTTEAFSLVLLLPFLNVVLEIEKAKTTGAVGRLQQVVAVIPEQHRLAAIGGMILTAILLKVAFKIWNTRYASLLVWTLREKWTAKMARNYFGAEYEYIASQKTGVLLNNLTAETNNSAKFLKFLGALCSQMLICFALYLSMILLDWRVVLVLSFLGGGVLFILRKVLGQYAFRIGQIRLGFFHDLTSLGHQILGAIREIKVYGLEAEEAERTSGLLRKMTPIFVRYDSVLVLPSALLELIIVGAVVACVCLLAYVGSTHIKEFVPLIGTFVVMGHRFIQTLSAATGEYMHLMTLVPALSVVSEATTATFPTEPLESGAPIRQINEPLYFEKVSFSYPGRGTALRDIDMTIEPGKTTAVVGPSGAGKSTIADLIVRFWKPNSGAITMGGRDTQQFSLDSWRKRISYVGQDSHIINGSVKQNISMGKRVASDDEIRAAAVLANANEFIEALPEDYDTILGERGLKISGGQRQRLAIARAVIREPDLYIFDEATSALDSRSEKQVQESIERIGKQATVVLIAHRLSTIRNADVIYHIENGGAKRFEGYHDYVTARNFEDRPRKTQSNS